MAISLAALDVDGTLRHRGTWNPGALDLLAELNRRDLKVALCSGRAPGSMMSLAAKLPEVSFLGCSSGSTVWYRSGDDWRLLAHRPLEVEVVNQALGFADEYGIEVWAYNERDWLVTDDSRTIADELTFIEDTPHLAELQDRADLGKILLHFSNPEQLARIKELDDIPGAAVVVSASGFADLVPEMSTQSKGCDYIMAYLRLTWENVFAMGDGENDLGMLSRAQVSVLVPPMTVDQVPEAIDDQVRVAVADTAGALPVVVGL